MEKWRQANPSPKATLSQVADHIDHVRKVAGIDHIGIGSDFDGIESTPVGLEDVSTYPALIAELLRRGYSDEDVKKILGLNILRVMRKLKKWRPGSRNSGRRLWQPSNSSTARNRRDTDAGNSRRGSRGRDRREWLAAGQGAAAPPIETLLERVSTYIAGFEKTLTGIVAEERYTQRLFKRVVIAGHTRTNQNPTTTRTLASDFLLVRTDDAVGWLPFRDVFAVDEEPVRDRDDRLTKLLIEPSAAASAQARRIMEEGARYNIGRVLRTINVPTIGLRLFAADFRNRCEFRKDRDEAIDGVATTCIRFQEKTRPTLIRGCSATTCRAGAALVSRPIPAACCKRWSRTATAARRYGSASATTRTSA